MGKGGSERGFCYLRICANLELASLAEQKGLAYDCVAGGPSAWNIVLW
jgi:hypothetical protein